MNRVEKMIRDSFLDLLKTKSFYNISVKEILEKDHISRTSFYKYYQDKYDLLDKIQKELISSFDQFLQNMVREYKDLEIINGVPADKRMYTGIFSFANENYDLLDCMFGPNSDGLFFDKIMEYIMSLGPLLLDANKLPEQFTNGEWDYINTFLAYGYLGIVLKWVHMGDKRKTAEEMGEMMSNIVKMYFSGFQGFDMLSAVKTMPPELVKMLSEHFGIDLNLILGKS